jgi:hypothetical protein
LHYPFGVQGRIALHESGYRDVKLCLAPRSVMPQQYRKVTIHAGMTVLV